MFWSSGGSGFGFGSGWGGGYGGGGYGAGYGGAYGAGADDCGCASPCCFSRVGAGSGMYGAGGAYGAGMYSTGGVYGAGGAVMPPTTQTYVGPAGDFVQETTYKYVGMGAGGFGLQPTAVSETVITSTLPLPVRGPNCCCLLFIPLGLCLLLLPFLLWAMMPDTSTTTTTVLLTTPAPLLDVPPPLPKMTPPPGLSGVRVLPWRARLAVAYDLLLGLRQLLLGGLGLLALCLQAALHLLRGPVRGAMGPAAPEVLVQLRGDLPTQVRELRGLLRRIHRQHRRVLGQLVPVEQLRASARGHPSGHV